CAWGPIADLARARLLLRSWADANRLPPFDVEKSGLSIDRDGSRLLLQFAPGRLTLTWRLDARCNPTAVTVFASPDYAGPRPDEAAVKRLVASLRAVTVEQHTPRSPTPSEFWRQVLTYPVVGLVIVAVGAVLVWSVGRRRGPFSS